MLVTWELTSKIPCRIHKKVCGSIEEQLFDSRICFTIIVYKSISHCCQYNHHFRCLILSKYSIRTIELSKILRRYIVIYNLLRKLKPIPKQSLYIYKQGVL